MKKIIMIMFLSLLPITKVFAIPKLQLYIENSSYNVPSETWVSKNNQFTLWVLGDTNISDVHLLIAHSSGENGPINITPTTASLLVDPSTPSVPVFINSGINIIPPLGNKTLPKHDIYGTGVAWEEYDLGDFKLKDSPIGDYSGIVPTSFPDKGQINAYDIDFTAYSWVHFDATGKIVSKDKTQYIFAPFSHDAESKPIPEPITMVLFGTGIVGLIGKKFRKKNR